MFTFDTKGLLMKSNAMWDQSLPSMRRGCISSAVAWWNALPHTECTSCHKFLSVPDQHWPAKVAAEERNGLVHSAVAGQLGGAPGIGQSQGPVGPVPGSSVGVASEFLSYSVSPPWAYPPLTWEVVQALGQKNCDQMETGRFKVTEPLWSPHRNPISLEITFLSFNKKFAFQ